MSNWYYNDKVITQLTINADYAQYYGFLYKITNQVNGMYYYGKKALWRTVRRAGPKKKDGTKSLRKRKVKQPSDWATYYSSNEELKAIATTPDVQYLKREILEFCFTKGEQSFKETEMLFLKHVLSDPKCLNGNISGRWFKKEQ